MSKCVANRRGDTDKGERRKEREQEVHTYMRERESERYTHIWRERESERYTHI